MANETWVATEAEARRLRSLVDEHGMDGASKAVGVSRTTLATLVARLPVSHMTLEGVRRYLDRQGRGAAR